MRRFICGIASLALILSCCSMVRAESEPRSALAALAIRMPEVKFDGTRFADAIDYLREASGANFHVDWRSLEGVGVTRDTPVSFSARRITLRKALNLILSQTANPGELAFYNDGGVIEITTKVVSDEVLITRVYDIEDLLVLPMSTDRSGGNTSSSGYSSSSSSSQSGSRGRSDGSGSGILSRSSRTMGGGGGSSYGGGRSSSSGSRTTGGTTSGTGANDDRAALADELVSLIIDTIEPDIWRDNGGTSSIRYFRGNLIVSSPRRIHERIGGAFE